MHMHSRKITSNFGSRLTSPALSAVVASVFSLAVFASAVAFPSQKKAAKAPALAVSGGLSVIPESGVINGSYGYQTVSAVFTTADSGSLDVTSRAAVTSSNPAVVKIVNGVAIPTGDGQADVMASINGLAAKSRITVKNFKSDANLSFANHMTPILIKYGCNGAACHGALNGQGGLKFSFFGYEPDKDREAIWTAAKGNRVNPKDPENSMLVLKATGVIPHNGGKRFDKGTPECRTFIAWVRDGGPVNPKSDVSRTADAPNSGATVKLASLEQRSTNAQGNTGARKLETISVSPVERTIKIQGSIQQMIVTAHYTDGTTEDVTAGARYASDDDGILSTNAHGQVTALRNGEANVMVRYNGKASVGRFYCLIKPFPTNYPKLSAKNLVDTAVFNKLRKVGIVPSELCNDYQFVRRASLDIAGKLPSAAQARSFAEDPPDGATHRHPSPPVPSSRR